ncbi:hypothetical protein J9Z47_003952 [Salmonella enterica]|nr:hypothetical protein [Salmonella enterica]
MNLTIGDITFSGGEAGYASATATRPFGDAYSRLIAWVISRSPLSVCRTT